MTDTTPGPDHRADTTDLTSSSGGVASSIDIEALAKQVADRIVPPTPVTTSAKAFVGSALAGVIAAGTAIVTAMGDGVITGGEWITVLGAAAVGAGFVGPGVYATTNRRVQS